MLKNTARGRRGSPLFRLIDQNHGFPHSSTYRAFPGVEEDCRIISLLWYNSTMNIDQWLITAQFSAAVGTLTLAYFAFKAIRETRNTQGRLRREGHLKEVADWAIDVMAAPSKAEIPAFPPELVGYESGPRAEVEQTLKIRHISNITNELELVACRGEYIRHVSERLDKDLHWKVGNTISQIVRITDDIRNEFRIKGTIKPRDELFPPMSEEARGVLKRIAELMAISDEEARPANAHTDATTAALTVTIGLVAVILATKFVVIEPNIGFAILCYVLGIAGMIYGFRKLGRFQ